MEIFYLQIERRPIYFAVIANRLAMNQNKSQLCQTGNVQWYHWKKQTVVEVHLLLLVVYVHYYP